MKVRFCFAVASRLQPEQIWKSINTAWAVVRRNRKIWWLPSIRSPACTAGRRRNLPTSTPPIVSQAALIAAVQTVKGSPISLKALISSIGCSEAGLRRPLQRLLDEGWAVIVTDKNDQRVRRVVATGKLLEALIQFADLIADRETQAESA